MGHPALEELGTLLPRAFFEAPPEVVAPRLLGKVLAHRAGGAVLAGRIVEAEAYLGPHNDPPDPAAHAHRGPTVRNSAA
jgi:DNA-3-methyladenine glycosylase